MRKELFNTLVGTVKGVQRRGVSSIETDKLIALLELYQEASERSERTEESEQPGKKNEEVSHGIAANASQLKFRLSSEDDTHKDKIKVDPDSKDGTNQSIEFLLEDKKHHNATKQELFKAAIQAGQNALKTAFLLNGGASIALLAFISKLAESQYHSNQVPLFADCLVKFVIGVFLIAFATGTNYLSQWLYAANTTNGNAWGNRVNIMSLLLGLGSYTFFCLGSYKAYLVFMANY
ncbi:hypothetical protein [Shewanella cyperi]|uniref:hypothetical protein n=1 Tax=Shewanella cyperi TaxID=2814292 RepID=UPI001A946141|nr:hypothetical protein [Shewanella cyperi]QSX39468.1 hypothetical protein JYB84_10445 [Shewanella cyperi]